jgi:hypothetical protein
LRYIHIKTQSTAIIYIITIMKFTIYSAVQLLLIISTATVVVQVVESKLADRSRVVKARHDSGISDRFQDNGRPIEGQSYRSTKIQEDSTRIMEKKEQQQKQKPRFQAQEKKKQQQQQRRTTSTITAAQTKPAPWQRDIPRSDTLSSTTITTTIEKEIEEQNIRRRMKGDVPMFVREDRVGNNLQQQSQHNNDEEEELDEQGRRKLSSQLTGCCYDYQNYYAADLCSLYGNDCESGETPSHDSGDSDCSQDGLSFIGISFSVNTASSNPYSYQLCDQFPMENIIDRDYDYVMSMDEDGWLVGGGYKTFDYSGKMP